MRNEVEIVEGRGVKINNTFIRFTPLECRYFKAVTLRQGCVRHEQLVTQMYSDRLQEPDAGILNVVKCNIQRKIREQFDMGAPNIIDNVHSYGFTLNSAAYLMKRSTGESGVIIPVSQKTYEELNVMCQMARQELPEMLKDMLANAMRRKRRELDY